MFLLSAQLPKHSWFPARAHCILAHHTAVFMHTHTHTHACSTIFIRIFLISLHYQKLNYSLGDSGQCTVKIHSLSHDSKSPYCIAVDKMLRYHSCRLLYQKLEYIFPVCSSERGNNSLFPLLYHNQSS